MYFAKQSKTFFIVTISLILIYYSSNPDHGPNINIQIFEAVHTYISATKRFIYHGLVCNFVNVSTPVQSCIFPFRFPCFLSYDIYLISIIHKQ